MNTTDLIGKRFGKLTVIEFYEKRNNRYYWKCKCDCGKETIVMRGWTVERALTQPLRERR